MGLRNIQQELLFEKLTNIVESLTFKENYRITPANAVLSIPFASYGVDGNTTFKPGI